MTRSFTGDIAFENVETIDGRMIPPEGLSWSGTVFLYTLSGENVGSTSKITRFKYANDERVIHCSGETILPSGTYFVGADVRVEHVDYQWEENGDPKLTTLTGRLLRIVVYTDAAGHPSWPAAHIIVTEETR